ncbi:hypothetical protein DMN91_007372 [Ooceraea biroi]|uniref:Uncharacterized protein n=1 Tax=Ooceraea biroi TaxID=2015173 RepID=A0A3L8DLI1_OOCBI|nr:uncharacterized protein LOC105282814 [Ooceraea biroi]RLU20759.1 hypothetical protein DMN91_007372 [Ooceraea biroi]
MAPLLLLISIIGSVLANPFPNTLDNRLVSQVQNALLLVANNRSNNMTDENLNSKDDTTENTTLSILKHTADRLKVSNPVTHDESAKKTTQRRKHKAIFVNYSLEPRVSHYPKNLPAYEVDYNDNSEITAKDKLRESKRYRESDIFYIRLPPTPYMFVPGLGYVSQPPTYSTAALKPQLALVPQLLHLPHARPTQPAQLQLAPQQITNPLIKLPIDFVSNGKPTSVYEWHKKSTKKPIDSPIMNLDSFVSNGKPTSIYQWPSNLKPIKRPDDSLNSLDLGPYAFNGKLTSVYLLGPDGSSSMHQPIRYPDYQDNIRNMYY